MQRESSYIFCEQKARRKERKAEEAEDKEMPAETD
jgi:hypothetical protein